MTEKTLNAAIELAKYSPDHIINAALLHLKQENEKLKEGMFQWQTAAMELQEANTDAQHLIARGFECEPTHSQSKYSCEEWLRKWGSE